MDERAAWHRLSVDEALKQLGSSAAGLTPAEAGSRLELHGPNELVEKKKRTLFMMFLGQFSDFMILVLIAAAVISGIIGEASDSIAIIVILVLNAASRLHPGVPGGKGNGSAQEDGRFFCRGPSQWGATRDPCIRVVPGDIVVVEAGGIVPADMRIIESTHLKVEEAALTGESEPVEKSAAAIAEEAPPLGDRRNLLYKGTIAVPRPRQRGRHHNRHGHRTRQDRRHDPGERR